MANHNGWTLWGGSVVDYAPYGPKKSTETEAIRLIKSIQFITPMQQPSGKENP